MPSRHTSRPLAAYFAAFAAAVMVPAAIMLGIVTHRYVEAEQSRLQGFAQTTAAHIASMLDRNVAAQIAMLQALATSPALKGKDYQTFDRQARELLIMQDAAIVLRDADGRQVVNTQLSWGAPLPLGTGSGADEIVTDMGRPHVSNLFVTHSTQKLTTNITVPVVHDDQTGSFLSVNLGPSYFSALLRKVPLPDAYHMSIADRTGRIIAASASEHDLTGQSLPGFAMTLRDQGTWTGLNSFGTEVLRTYKRSDISGWMVSVGVEKAVFSAPLHHSLSMLALIGAALLLIGGGLAAFIFRTMLSAFQILRSLATHLSEGCAVTAPVTPITEANVIGSALATASAELRQQAQALEQSKQELEHKVEERTRELSDKSALIEATLDNMDQGLLMIDQAGRVPVYNRRAAELLELPKDFMAQRPHLHALIRLLAEAGEYQKADESLKKWLANDVAEPCAYTFERERPDGTVLEIRTVPISTGGAVRTFTDVTERHRATQNIAHMAHHDSLTGLANRVLFRERLDSALTDLRDTGKPFSVMFLDLDRFKAINDSMGHGAGDQLISMVAQRLPPLARSGDTVARLGGDEFAIIRIGQGDAKRDAAMLADRLLAAIRDSYQLQDRQVLTSASIGVAMAPDDGGMAEQLLKAADLALYKAKADGRNDFRFFDAAMDREARDRHAIEVDLRSAMTRDEFALHYQPVVNAADQTTCGVEALVRWRHPDRGMVSPSVFIPLAEETGLIVALGEWVLRRACADAAGWPAHVKVAVNLSPVQLRKSSLVEVVASALNEAGLPPERLELEITETVLLEKAQAAIAALHALRRMGVSIVLDDFGTGYSSLSYLRAFPFDKIKIDKSFVDEMQSRTDCAAIVSAVAGLARTLNMATTAEGVETPEQLALLRAAGCGQAQGYLFSRPRPLAELDFGPHGKPQLAASHSQQA
jgi:diguanylate cyclase (GGDEF)-like protein